MTVPEALQAGVYARSGWASRDLFSGGDKETIDVAIDPPCIDWVV
jgi:hypothetical protein